jgi:hypothetical protein
MTTTGAGDEVAEPAAEPSPEPPVVLAATASPVEHHRARSVVATVVGVLAVLLLTVTVIGVWARATVLRAEPVADMAGNAIAQPEVQQALAAYLADAAANAVDLQAQLTSVLPDALDQFVPSIAAGAEGAVERALERVLATPQFEQIVRNVVERAHARAMRLLQGDGLVDGVNVADGRITLNTLPLITSALTELQSATGLLSNVTFPQLTADGDPAQQIAQLEQAIGRDLPDDFGQLTVYQSDAVARAQESVRTAQRLLALSQRALWLLVIVTVVLIAASILVAARRGRAVLVLALGTAAALVLVRSAVRAVVDAAPDLTDRPGAKAAIRSILGDARQSLLRVTGVVLLVALVAVVVMLLVRHWRRGDLVLTAAVALGAITTAAIGVGSWGLLAGLVVGIAVPFVVNWLWKSRPPAAGTPAATTPPGSPPTPTVTSVPAPAASPSAPT